MHGSTGKVNTGRAEPWSVVVFDQHQTVMAHSKRSATLPYIPMGMMSDPIWLLDNTAALFAPVGEGNLIVPFVPLEDWRYGATDRDPHEMLREFVARARSAGWTCTDAVFKHKSGWVTFTRAGSSIIHMGILDAMARQEAAQRPVLFSVVDTAERIARALVLYRDAVGVPYRATAGVAGLAMIKEHYERLARPVGKRAGTPAPRWQWRDAPELATPSDLIWSRPLTPAERALGYVHGYDIYAQYLAAAGVAELGRDVPVWCGPEAFDPLRPGYWRIIVRGSKIAAKLAALTRGGLPPVLNPARIESDGTAAVTTPVMVYLAELGIHPEVVAACLSTTRTRLLRPWAERLRDALVLTPAADCPGLRPALKDTYTHAIGMMGAPTSGLHRPDFADTIRDGGRVNLHRKIHTAHTDHGLSPVKVNRDCVYYASDNPDPAVLGELLGSHKRDASGRLRPVRQVGKYKHESTQTVAGYLAAERAATARRKASRS